MATLQPIFKALGYADEAQQLSLVKLLQSAGAYGELPGAGGMISDHQAKAVLAAVDFPDTAQAAEWLRGVTRDFIGQNPNHPLRILAEQVTANFDTLQNTKYTPPPTLVFLNPNSILADPATYQFRFNADCATGVTCQGKFSGNRWDPILHGDPLLVHERLDGRIFVADGHHHLELAKRAENKPDAIAALVLREADGYTPEDVKIIAAYRNIQHGRANPVEAALVLKEAKSAAVHQDLLPVLQMDKGNLAVAVKLAALSPESLGMVASGDVPAEAAALVPGSVQNEGHEKATMRLLAEKFRKPESFRDRLQEGTCLGHSRG